MLERLCCSAVTPLPLFKVQIVFSSGLLWFSLFLVFFLFMSMNRIVSMARPAARMMAAMVIGESSGDGDDSADSGGVVGVGLVTVKLTVWAAIFPAVSCAVSVRLCSPVDSPVSVQLPLRADALFASRRQVMFACLFRVKSSGMLEVVYVVFSGDKIAMSGDVESMKK